MARYHGRHAARHAAPRVSPLRRAGGSLARPAVSSSLALAVLAGGAAVVSTGDEAEADSSQLRVSATALSAADAQSEESTADAARLVTERSGVTQQRAAVAGRAEAAARAKAAAVAKARRAAAEKAARAKQRQALIDNAKDNPQSAARALMGDYGFDEGQFGCLVTLWTGESDWNFRATNPSSGAYGIPQSLPASKMATVGADYRDNPVTQIKWGLQYIKDAYGTPCNALSQWQSRMPHWY